MVSRGGGGGLKPAASQCPFSGLERTKIELPRISASETHNGYRAEGQALALLAVPESAFAARVSF